jgi:branched-chain amino acid transport system substrate-binding protein
MKVAGKITLASLLLAGLFGISGLARADINIGIDLSLTGPGSALGIPMNAYYTKLFPKTIAGQKVNLIILDDATDPGKGVSNVRRLTTEDKVDVIIGSTITPVAAAIAPVAVETKTVQLAASPVGLPDDSWSFRLPQGSDVMMFPIAEHMKKTGVKTVGFIGYSDAYGEVWLKALNDAAAKYGFKVVDVERFARPDTSVTPQALKLAAAKPDAILVVATGSGAAMPELGLLERGYKGQIYQTHAAATPALMRVGGKAIDGTYVVSGPAVIAEQLPDSHPSKKRAVDFVTSFEKANGAGTRDQFAGHAYDSQVALEKAIPLALKKAKPGTPEFRAALKDALETMGRTIFAHGVMNWSKTDHWGFTNETGVLLQVVNGQFEVVK